MSKPFQFVAGQEFENAEGNVREIDAVYPNYVNYTILYRDGRESRIYHGSKKVLRLMIANGEIKQVA